MELLRLLRHLMHMSAEIRKTHNNSLPLSNAAVHINKVRKRILHAAKGTGNLHQPAKRNLLSQITVHCYHKRKNYRNLRITGIQKHKLLLFINKLPKVIQQQLKPILENLALLRFATIKGNTLRTFTQANHTETKISLIALLNEIQLHQLAAYDMRNIGAQNRI